MERDEIESAQVDMNLAHTEALNGVPKFLDIPDALVEVLQNKTMAAERMFWLRATHIKKDIVNTTLLRRAVYAEQRVQETEHMLAEMALITEGAKEEIERLQGSLSEMAGKVS